MRVTFAHAPYNFQKGCELWEELRVMSSSNLLPWVYLGDLNEVLSYWENVGKCLIEISRMIEFQVFLNACLLMDMEIKGCNFTWSNSRDKEANIKVRLERVLCNIESRILFPEAKAFALLAVGSDHSPIVLSLQGNNEKHKKEFKFEAFWLENNQCKEIMKEVWDSPLQVEKNLLGKLRAVTFALTKWSKKTFRNGQKRICSLKQELLQYMNRSDSPFNREKVKKL